MKKLILLMTLMLSSALFKVADAQVGINVNIESQPVWGPTGYDYAEYYYFPDMDVYYHIPDRMFAFFDGRNWISGYSLPPYYRNYDLYRSYKVVINEARPFIRNDYWHSRYSSYRGRQQEIIYNSREPKYYVINEHPEHGRWIASRSNNDGRYNDNRPGNAGRNEGYRNDDRRYDNNQRPGANNPRFSEMNNQRPADIARSDRDRMVQPGMDNNGRINDNSRPNEAAQRDNRNGQDRRDGGRRN